METHMCCCERVIVENLCTTQYYCFVLTNLLIYLRLYISEAVLLVADLGENKLTVGKIYAGLLIAENWKAFKTSAKTSGVSWLHNIIVA